MGKVTVADRGAREIVVFLSGVVDDAIADQLHGAVEQVAELEHLNALDHVVVDMHKITELDDAGVRFLHELIHRGNRSGFNVSFAACSGAAHRALEAAGWSFMEHSPPAIPAPRPAPGVTSPEQTRTS